MTEKEFTDMIVPKHIGDYRMSVYRTAEHKYIAFARYKHNPLASVWSDEFDTLEQATAMVYGWENTITASATEKKYMNIATGSVDTHDGWWYEDEDGVEVNAVDRGEVVEIESNTQQ